MNKLDLALSKLVTAKKTALMTHVVLGYPTMKESIELVRAMAEGGTSFIELQIPFSDPMADGPTIMEANEFALRNGIKVKDCMIAAEKLARIVDVPLIFMSYANIVLSYKGPAKGSASLKTSALSQGKSAVRNFCKDASQAGISAMIVPDIPPEENSEEFWNTSYEYNLHPIPIVSPVSSPERLKVIKKITEGGFLYCVSTTGITGARTELPQGLGEYLKKASAFFKRPLAVGFGISTPEQVKAVGRHAEIAVVGSAMIDLINRTPAKKRVAEVLKFTKKLSAS